MRAVVVLASLALASPATAQQMCAPMKQIEARLKQMYDEVKTAGGISEDGGMATIVLSSPKGTFTVILATPDGRGCFLGAGVNWSQEEIKKGAGS